MWCSSISAEEADKRTNADVSLPDGFETALLHRTLLLDSFTVEYEAKREFFSSSEVPGGHAETDIGLCVLSIGRFYQHSERTSTNPPSSQPPIEQEHAFDGSIFYSGTPRKTGTSQLQKYLGENQGDDRAANLNIQNIYLKAAGFEFPESISAWRTGRLRSFILKSIDAGKLLLVSKVSSELILLLEIPDPLVISAKNIDLDRIAAHDSNEEIIKLYRELRSRKPVRQIRLTLDSSKEYAIQRREDRTADGELIQTIDCEDFELIHKEGLWLPRSCIMRDFAKSPQFLKDFTSDPTAMTSVKRTKFSFAIPDTVSFTIAYGPGSTVADRSSLASRQETTGAIDYRVPATSEAARAAAAAISRKSYNWNTLLIVNGVFLGAFAVYFLMRRRAS